MVIQHNLELCPTPDFLTLCLMVSCVKKDFFTAFNRRAIFGKTYFPFLGPALLHNCCIRLATCVALLYSFAAPKPEKALP
jgi:hypothetical protein